MTLNPRYHPYQIQAAIVGSNIFFDTDKDVIAEYSLCRLYVRLINTDGYCSGWIALNYNTSVRKMRDGRWMVISKNKVIRFYDYI